MAGPLRYALDEATTSLWRGRQAGFLSTATIAIALFVLGGFLIVTANLERLSAEWGNAAEMSVFLDDDISPSEQQAIEQIAAPGDVVAAREFVSKSEALLRFKRTFSAVAAAVDSVGDNPLPASVEVRLKASATAGAEAGIEQLATTLRGMPGVADVQYDQQWLHRLLSTIGVIRSVGLVLGTVLAIAAALTVANVVRLALHARRDEIDIMQLVGAPDAYIRGPFVMEGVLQGGLGALVAVAALGAVFWSLRARYLAPLAEAVNLSTVRFLPLELCGLMVVGGMAVGCLGGLVAAWRA